MNELTTIRDLGEALDHELRGPSPQLRRRVLTDIGGRPRQAMRKSLRPGWRIVVTAGLVAALLTVSTVRLWGASPAASAQAADILRRAAVAAAHQPALTARPSQFIFVKAVESAATLTGNSSGQITGVHIHTVLREIWLSAAGTKNGLLREQPWSTSTRRPAGQWQTMVLPGCHKDRPNPASGTAGAASARASRGSVPLEWMAGGRCVPQPAYLSGLPASAPAMLTYLYRHSHGQNPPPVQAFITAGDLIREAYVRPAALAALFAAVAQIAGVSVAEHAVNAAAQHGIAVQQTFRGISEQLIFNPQTYAFIGERQVAVSAASGLRIGTILDSTAVLRLAVVSHAGQLP